MGLSSRSSGGEGMVAKATTPSSCGSSKTVSTSAARSAYAERTGFGAQSS
jgi:hypothetical protein